MILDAAGGEVGRVVLPDPDAHTPGAAPHPYDFILVSEGQFFGDEKSIDGAEYPLFNVMMVSWKNGQAPFATRLAMGKVNKEAWWKATNKEELVCLE